RGAGGRDRRQADGRKRGSAVAALAGEPEQHFGGLFRAVLHHEVIAVGLVAVPAVGLRPLAETRERGLLVPGGEDVALARDGAPRRPARGRFGQRQQRVVADHVWHRPEVLGRAERTDQARAVLLGVDVPAVLEFAGDVPQALAVAGQEG